MLNKIVNGRTDLVINFVEAGNSPSFKDENNFSLVQWCAYFGDVSAIKYLLQKGASLKELGENYDLNGAAFHGHWRLTQFLLEQGANVNFRLEDTGETPLHAALCKAKRPAYNMVIQLLLAAGANPNLPTKPNIETGAFMRDVRTKGETPLHRAAAFSDYETILSLLHAGADKAKKDINGDSPLSWASWHLRPAKILAVLCYADFRVHPDQIREAVSDHGSGWGNGMEVNLLGNVNLE